MRSPTPRRWPTICAAACVSTTLAAASLVLATPTAAAPDHKVWTDRAVDSYDALQAHLYLGDDGHNLYLERYPKQTGDNEYSFFWPLREATVATIDLSQLPTVGDRYRHDVSERFAAVGRYWDGDAAAYGSYPAPPLASGGDPFYDDNAIIGLDFVRQHRISGDPVMLDRAKRTFRFIVTGWDTDPSRPCVGGLHWVDATWSSIKATNATSLAAELAVELYEETGSAQYLEWGERAYQWVRDCLRSADGLYYNDIAFDGTVNETLWIYNSGAMIGAATLLYRATGDSTYLAQARRDADAALAYWTAGVRYYEQPAIFNAIFFKNLLMLDSVRHDPGYRRALAHYAELIWEHNRDPRTGLFSFDASGGGRPDPSVRPETLEQSAAIQIFAMLGWKAKDYHHEAEEHEPVIATGVDIVGPDVVNEPFSTVRFAAEFTPEDTSYPLADWSVTEPDGSPTDKAQIDDFGSLTVNDEEGDVRVTARAADGGGATASRTVTIDLDPALLRGNAARWPTATVTASSQYSDDYAADNVRDGITGQWAVGEWASAGEQNPWIQLNWEQPIQADEVVLYDRSIPEDVNGGTLSFSDGSTVPVSGVPADGAPKSVSFPMKTFDWVRFQVEGGTGPNVGLSEFEVHALPSAPGTPTDASATPGTGEATVSWRPPAFDGGTPLTDYVVTPYRDGVALDPVTVDADTTTVLVSGLSAGEPYRFTVRARNLAGTGSESPPTEPVTPF